MAENRKSAIFTNASRDRFPGSFVANRANGSFELGLESDDVGLDFDDLDLIVS
jgi:hypothetical protein